MQMQINDAHDMDKDPDLDMHDIQKPNSMESSMNSTSQAPQIIVRRNPGNNNDNGQENAY